MPKKRFGQHFLNSQFYARRIAEAVPATAESAVLEIGAGEGALSVFLKQRFPAVHLVEMDRDVIPRLREKMNGGQWTLHECNALDFDFPSVGIPLHLVGNLPYNIGAVLIKKALLYGNSLASCTFMVQREVAQRIVARQHTKANGYLSMFCQFFGTPRILFHVPAGAFFPKPNVESSVFQMTIAPDLESRLPRSQWESFFALIDKGFSMRRKMLATALGFGGDARRYREILTAVGVPPTSRPEDMGVEQWLNLYKCIHRQES